MEHTHTHTISHPSSEYSSLYPPLLLFISCEAQVPFLHLRVPLLGNGLELRAYRCTPGSVRSAPGTCLSSNYHPVPSSPVPASVRSVHAKSHCDARRGPVGRGDSSGQSWETNGGFQGWAISFPIHSPSTLARRATRKAVLAFEVHSRRPYGHIMPRGRAAVEGAPPRCMTQQRCPTRPTQTPMF